jgi:DNA mismatch repair protein MutL
MSCHGAIRAGKVMSVQEMKSLLDQMEEQPFSSFCPHGRPVSVQITHYDLEKLFKRIV